jgi:two-component system LytT family sensor kinase
MTVRESAAVMPMSRNAAARVWLWYALGWIPVVVVYSISQKVRSSLALLVEPRPMTWAESLFGGFGYVLPVALLGVAVWWLTRVLPWAPRNLSRFVVTHVMAAVTFSLLWLGIDVGLIALNTGVPLALRIASTFAGFQFLDGFFVYGLIAAVSYVARIAKQLREQEARVARADALRMHAELAALRGQLNPHFLFNTLHTLTALVRRDPATAENALERFGDMLRYVLDVKRSAREDVTLEDEMVFLRNYLSLEQLRLGDRLRVVERLDPDALECVIPSLTLQPLVENAIKYGIAPRARGGSLEIVAALDGDALVLEVRDDGPGARSDVLESGKGVGLRAVRQRLETRYNGKTRFAVTTAPNKGFVVRLRLPASTNVETPADGRDAAVATATLPV